jgi:hypothetical protein
VVARPIASGEVVLDSLDSPLRRLIEERYNDAAAIEMEGAGVALACHLNESRPVVVLRGISDRADGRKEVSDSDGGQPRAARNAAAFAMTLLADIPPNPAAAAGAVEEALLRGTTDQQIAAVYELGDKGYANAVPLLEKGFNATLDPDVSCRIIEELAGLGTTRARDALRALKPRYAIEELLIRDSLKAWPDQP